MLANTADAGGTEYNTVDGTLWFLHALDRHVDATGDLDLVGELAAALRGIVDHHVAGTRFGIRVDPSDGLLTQGAEGWALTWMDARVDGRPITARAGKAVEVNALWMNGLTAAAGLLGRIGRGSETIERLASAGTELVRQPVHGARTKRPGRRRRRPVGRRLEPSPEPAAGRLPPHAPLRAPAVVAACAPLVTSLGLRSLAPGDPRYRPVHRGGPSDRDAAYHQGTVWPWLIGPYVEAVLRTGVRPTACSTGWRPTSASGGWARCPRRRTAMPPTGRPAARSRRGRWPS